MKRFQKGSGRKDGAGKLEELLAERVAVEATRVAEERIKKTFRITEFDSDEVYGPMDSR